MYQRDARCLTIPPIQVFFQVVEADRLVRIAHVRRVPSPREDGNGANGSHGQGD
jgi:hypothetical protein